MDSHALTTKERIKDRLQITATTWDNLFDSLILAVTDRIERMTNRRFLQATYTEEIYDGSDLYGSFRYALVIKNAPVAVLSAIEYRAGTHTNPDWTAFTADEYDFDADLGVVYFTYGMPRGRRNIRVTYTGGYTGYTIGVNSYWVFNATPGGTVDGSNTTFTLPEDASEIIVYADGLRIKAADYTFTEDDDSFEFAAGKQPYSTISVDYLPSASDPDSGDDITLPLDILEVCEEAVVRLFKRRDSEGRTSETFQESSITWEKGIFSDDSLDIIRSYRRASFL